MTLTSVLYELSGCTLAKCPDFTREFLISYCLIPVTSLDQCSPVFLLSYDTFVPFISLGHVLLSKWDTYRDIKHISPKGARPKIDE